MRGGDVAKERRWNQRWIADHIERAFRRNILGTLRGRHRFSLGRGVVMVRIPAGDAFPARTRPRRGFTSSENCEREKTNGNSGDHGSDFLSTEKLRRSSIDTIFVSHYSTTIFAPATPRILRPSRYPFPQDRNLLRIGCSRPIVSAGQSFRSVTSAVSSAECSGQFAVAGMRRMTSGRIFFATSAFATR